MIGPVHPRSSRFLVGCCIYPVEVLDQCYSCMYLYQKALAGIAYLCQCKYGNTLIPSVSCYISEPFTLHICTSVVHLFHLCTYKLHCIPSIIYASCCHTYISTHSSQHTSAFICCHYPTAYHIIPIFGVTNTLAVTSIPLPYPISLLLWISSVSLHPFIVPIIHIHTATLYDTFLYHTFFFFIS
jgi:hypothetical protein